MPGNCLIVVDMQNDFVHPGGSLYINKAELIIKDIEILLTEFEWQLVIFTQDWHPVKHISFYTTHPDTKIGQIIETDHGKQILWPPHCIQNTHGAKIVKELIHYIPYIVIQKGYHEKIDSYSAFADQSETFMTGLNEILTTNSISDVFICGVATNYCVKFTAMDSLKYHYNTYVIADATATVSDDLETDLKDLQSQGILITYSHQWK